jgi:hypothetical protein
MKFTALRKKVIAATFMLGLLSFVAPQQANARCVTGCGICGGRIAIVASGDGSIRLEISLTIGVEE